MNLAEISNNFSDFIDLVLRATPSSSRNASFRFPTSEFLIKTLGFPNLEMHIQEHTIRKIFDFHGVSPHFLKQLPELFNNANEAHIAFVFKSHTQQDGAVVVSFEFVGQKPIIIAIHKNKRINGSDYVNHIASVYEKDNAEETFKRWQNNQLLLYKNTKKDLNIPAKRPIIIRKR